MNDDVQAGLVLTLGALALRLGLTDAHLAYIRPAMGPILALAGGILVVLGGVVLLRPGGTGSTAAVGDAHGHDHTGPSRVVWLLVGPILAIAVVVPRPLGSFAANRARATIPASSPADLGPLPPPAVPGGPVDLSLKDFVGRAVYDQGQSLHGRAVRLDGFVTPDVHGDGFLLTRFVVTCCAADARPIRVTVRGVAPPAADTWLQVTGTWHPEQRHGEDDRPPILDATDLRPIPAPVDPYLR